MKAFIQYTFFIGILLCCGIGMTQAQVGFTASSNARQVVLGNYFNVTYTLKNAQGADFKAPSFKGFRVISGPSQSNSMSIINGQRSQETSISYSLQPEKIGTFTIPPASIAVNGQTLRSNMLTVQVVKGKKGATTQAQLDQALSEQVFVKIIPNTTEARIGQQIVLDYKIFFNIDIQQVNLLSESDYDGFYTHEMNQYPNSMYKEVIDGVQYNTKILRRIALFPQQAGLLNIDAAQIQVGVAVKSPQKRRRSFFFRPEVKRHNLVTNPVQINVQPLPSNAPATFTGAVGKYNILCDIEKVNITTDDAAIITMRIEGNGDVKQIQAPPLLLNSDTLEVYEPRIVNEKTYEHQAILFSEKELEYLVLPKFPGVYHLRPAFTYFDTDSLRYITLQPRTFVINVRQGSNTKSTILPTGKKDLADGDIRFIKTESKLKKKGNTFFGSVLFYVLWGLPLVGFLGYFFYRRRQQGIVIDPTALRRNKAQQVAQKRLVTAQSHLQSNSSKAFYDETSKAMLGYISDKLNIPTSQLSKNNVREKLQGLQIDALSIEKFMEIIKNCEIALFAGMDNSSAMQTTYDNTLAVIASIEEGFIAKK